MYAWILVLGCAPRLPSASVDDLTLVAADLGQATVDVAIAVDNPLPFALGVDAIEWDVDVGGVSVAHGVADAPQQVPGRAVAVVHVPVTARYADVLAAGYGANGASYAVSGQVVLSTALGAWRVPIDHAGTLPTLAMPSVDLVDAGIGLDGAAIAVFVALRVGLPDAVRLSDVTLAVSTAEAELARGSAAVDAAGTLTLRAWVDPSAAAWATAQAWAGAPGELHVALTGSLATPIGVVPVRHDLHRAW